MFGDALDSKQACHSSIRDFEIIEDGQAQWVNVRLEETRVTAEDYSTFDAMAKSIYKLNFDFS
jgi:hypothetical protein